MYTYTCKYICIIYTYPEIGGRSEIPVFVHFWPKRPSPTVGLKH